MSAALVSMLKSASSRHRPWQIAAAFALGCAAGLLPIATPLFWLCAALIFLLPVHLPVALLGGSLAVAIHPWLRPWADQVGWWALTHPQLRPHWDRIESLPLIPWLSLHNSIVQGSVLVASASLLPNFIVCHWLARRLVLAERLDYQHDAVAVEDMTIDDVLLSELLPNEATLLPSAVKAGRVDQPAEQPDTLKGTQSSIQPLFLDSQVASSSAAESSLDRESVVEPASSRGSSGASSVVPQDAPLVHNVDILLAAESDDSAENMFAPAIEIKGLDDLQEVVERTLSRRQDLTLDQEHVVADQQSSAGVYPEAGQAARDPLLEPIAELEELLAGMADDDVPELGAPEVLERAAKVVSLVDDLLQALESVDAATEIDAAIEVKASDNVYQPLHEEVSLSTELADTDADQMNSTDAMTKPSRTITRADANSESAPTRTNQLIQRTDAAVTQSEMDEATANSIATAYPLGRRVDAGGTALRTDGEEALHYLLQHLRALRDKV